MSGKHCYTDEKNAQIVISLLKAHGIRKVVANPGTTNIAFVGSVQNDPWFQVYSGVDERHSAYLACGMSAESGEPVVLSCTGATASRNYLSALTEAYYRKLPILALTSIHHMNAVGNLLPQMLDRNQPLKDTVRYSCQCRVPHTQKDVEDCVSNVNKAILELRRHGGGPVHINLETERVSTFNTATLPSCRVIRRIMPFDREWPKMEAELKVAVWIGAHRPFDSEEVAAIEAFVRSHNAAVFVDHTSGYYGCGAVHSSLLCSQAGLLQRYAGIRPDLTIQIGEISGDYPSASVLGSARQVWRVSEDGEARDLFGGLTQVFEMPERVFFDHYKSDVQQENAFLKMWHQADSEVRVNFPDVAFANFWVSHVLHDKLQIGSEIHFGILNSLRSWNLQLLPAGVTSNCNVGGFGIDGCMSAFLGASLVHPDKLYFLAIGDLAFFYDMNSLGNRHVGKNVRILLVNNGCGGEFNLYHHYGAQFGAQTNDYIAAGRHNGNQSKELVKHYVQDLGFKYLAASTKEEFNARVAEFVDPKITQPMLFECFTRAADESDACYRIDHILPVSSSPGSTIRKAVKAVVPQRVKNAVKELIK